MPTYFNSTLEPTDPNYIERVLAHVSDMVGKSMYQQGITPQQLASDLNISIDQVAQYYSGKYDFSIPEILRLEKYLHITILTPIE